MEQKDNPDFIIEDIRDFSYKLHQEEIESKQKYIKNHTNELNSDNETKQMIEEFKVEIKNRNKHLQRINFFRKNKTVPRIIVEDKYFGDDIASTESSEPLYSNNKEISLYETNQKGESEFVVKQRGNISTCYFMAWILGLINMGRGSYIKENIVREYNETHAIVHLYDDDGLPVDIIVSKTRPNLDPFRPL